MTRLTVFDPAMCCASGVCGPEVDPKLVQFAADLDWLKSRGVKMRRVNLSQEPVLFAENEAVKALLEKAGTAALPAILVGDELVSSGTYPSRGELAELVGVGAEANAEDFAMNSQVKELIALGAAIGASCNPCFKFHAGKARELGASDAQLREVVEIGEAVKAASARHISTLAEHMLAAEAPATGEQGCCGGGKGKGKGGKSAAKGCCGGGGGKKPKAMQEAASGCC